MIGRRSRRTGLMTAGVAIACLLGACSGGSDAGSGSTGATSAPARGTLTSGTATSSTATTNTETSSVTGPGSETSGTAASGSETPHTAASGTASPGITTSSPGITSAETSGTAGGSRSRSSTTQTTPETSTAASATTPTGTTDDIPAVPDGWTAQQVSFDVHGITVYATYLRPSAAPSPVPAAVLIAGSGPTDRDGNNPLSPGSVNTLRFLARSLAANGVASLRYDKLGSGKTGLGTYAAHPDTVGITPFTREAQAALTFVARQPQVDRHRLSIYGHSEGALFALIVATTDTAGVPPVHSLGLIEPLSKRYLDVITEQVTAQVHQQKSSGVITASIAKQALAQLHAAVTQLRAKGTVPSDLGFGLQSLFNPGTLRFLRQADAIDPATLAATLPPTTPVLITCSDADIQVSCTDVKHLAGAVAPDALDFVTLHGVDHVLKQDDSRTAANYGKDLPFSTQFAEALTSFARR